MLSEILNDPPNLIFVVVSLFMLIELIMTIVYFFITKRALVNAKITKIELISDTHKAYITLKDTLGNDINTTIILPITHSHHENDEIEVVSYKNDLTEVKVHSFMVVWGVPVMWLNTCIMTGILQLFLVFKNIAKYPF